MPGRANELWGEQTFPRTPFSRRRVKGILYKPRVGADTCKMTNSLILTLVECTVMLCVLLRLERKF